MGFSHLGLILGVPHLSGGELPAFYVTPTGDDITGDGSAAAPWATIDHAIDNVPDVACNIWVAEGTYPENTDGGNYLRPDRVFADWVTVRAMPGASVTITDNGSGTLCLRLDGTQKLRFRGVTIEQAGANSSATVQVENDTDVELIDCDIPSRNIGIYSAPSNSSVRIYCKNTTFHPRAGSTSNVRSVWIRAGANSDVDVVLVDCTAESLSANNTYNGTYFETTSVSADLDVYLSGGDYTDVLGTAIRQYGGSLIAVNVAAESDEMRAITVGVDGGATYNTTGAIVGGTFTSQSGHGAAWEYSATGTMSGATVHGGNFGLVLKEVDGVDVDDCALYGGTDKAVYFKGARNAGVTNSTLHATAGSCVLAGYNNITGTNCANLTFTDNLCVPTGTLVDVFSWADTDEGGSVCDRNTYVLSGTTGDLGNVYGTDNISNLSELQAAWAAYDVPTNDANSEVVT